MSRHGMMYQDIVPYTSRFYDKGKFGRMFPNLPAFASNNSKVKDALKDMGKKGGIMDATAIKTIARSNPFVLILKNGKIVEKLPAQEYLSK